jgi:hypothetical protein
MNALQNVKKRLCEIDLQDLVNDLCSLYRHCENKDGSGLSSGSLVEFYIADKLKDVAGFSTYNKGESDIKIDDHCLSLKKINGRSSIALDWSKNTNDSKKTYFNNDIMIINLKNQIWWKKSPKKPSRNVAYSREIRAGIYLIDKDFCKQHVLLTSNNKTNSLVSSEYLYIMLLNSINNDLFIEFPLPTNIQTINFTNLFK